MGIEISLITAFVAGIFSFLSPCILPLVPGYISYISGIALKDLTSRKYRILWLVFIRSCFFVFGFTFIFVSLGASATFIGKIFVSYHTFFTKIAGLVIVLFGINLIGWIKFGKQKNFMPGLVRGKLSNLGALLLGMSFAFGWIPCIGPILGGILTMASLQEKFSQGIFLLLFYSLGMGIAFIFTALAMGFFLKLLRKFSKYIRYTEIFAGVILIIIGGLIFFNKLETVANLLPQTFLKFIK